MKLAIFLALMMIIGVSSAQLSTAPVAVLNYYSDPECAIFVDDSILIADASAHCREYPITPFASRYMSVSATGDVWVIQVYSSTDTTCNNPSPNTINFILNSGECKSMTIDSITVFARVSSATTAVLYYCLDFECKNSHAIPESLLVANSGTSCRAYPSTPFGSVGISVVVSDDQWIVNFHEYDDCTGLVTQAVFSANKEECVGIFFNSVQIYATIYWKDIYIKYTTYSEPTCTIPDAAPVLGYTGGCMPTYARFASLEDRFTFQFDGECSSGCIECMLSGVVSLYRCIPVSEEKYIYAELPDQCLISVSTFAELNNAIENAFVRDICITADMFLPQPVQLHFISDGITERDHLRIRSSPGPKMHLTGSAPSFAFVIHNVHVYFENLIFDGFPAQNMPILSLESVAKLSVKGCEFQNNVAKGAIFAGGNTFLAVYQSIFTSNSNNVERHGGSIEVRSAIQVTIVETEFRNMIMDMDESYGAAIYADSTILHLEEVHCNGNGNQYASHGGCVYALETELTVVNSHFENLMPAFFDDSDLQFKSTERSGAAIVARGHQNVYIHGSTFENNRGRIGGAIVYSTQFNDEDPDPSIASMMMIDQCTFSSNTAATGGAIIAQGKVLIQNCTFNENRAMAWMQAPLEFQGYGGAVISFGYPIIIENCVFTANEAHGLGGAVAYSDWFFGTSMVVNNCKFESNVGKFGAGAISYFHPSLFGDSDVKPDSQVSLTITDTEFFSNEARNEILVPYVDMLSALGGHGGAISLAGKINATITDCLFDEDVSTGAGSAIYAVPLIYTQKAQLSIINTQFIQGITLDSPILQLVGNTSLFMRDSVMEKKKLDYFSHHIFLGAGAGVFNTCVFKGTGFANAVSPAVISAESDPDSSNLQLAMGNCEFTAVNTAINVRMRNANALLTFNTIYTEDLEHVAYQLDTNNPAEFCDECESRNAFLCKAIDFCTLPENEQNSIMSEYIAESSTSYIEASTSSAEAILSSIMHDPVASSSYGVQYSSLSALSYQSSTSYIEASTSSAEAILSSILQDPVASSSYAVQHSIRSRLSALSYQASTSAYAKQNSNEDDEGGFNIVMAAAAGGGGLLLLLLLLILVVRRRKSNKNGNHKKEDAMVLGEFKSAGGADMSGSVFPMVSNPSSQHNKVFAPSQRPVNDYEPLHYDKLQPSSSQEGNYADIATSTNNYDKLQPSSSPEGNYADVETSTKSNGGNVNNLKGLKSEIDYASIAHP